MATEEGRGVVDQEREYAFKDYCKSLHYCVLGEKRESRERRSEKGDVILVVHLFPQCRYVVEEGRMSCNPT